MGFIKEHKNAIITIAILVTGYFFAKKISKQTKVKDLTSGMFSGTDAYKK